MIHEIARTYVGTPFRHMGRLPGVGLDCVGVVLCSAWASGIDLPDVRDYGRVPDPEMVLAAAKERATPVETEWVPGDVLCIQWRAEMPMHLAVLGYGWVVQAMDPRGVVLTSLTRQVRTRVHSVWRLG